MRGYFSGYRWNYLHNIIISRRTLRHGVSYAMSILEDNVIPNDHYEKLPFAILILLIFIKHISKRLPDHRMVNYVFCASGVRGLVIIGK